MASVNITSALNKIGLTRFGGIFLWLILHRQFVATTVLWTKPAPSWTQTDSNDIRTVDIQVLKGSTHIHLSWNYTLSEGSDLRTTTFSISDGSSWNDIGVIYHADNNIVIYNKNNYRTRFNISDSNVATLILKKVTEDEQAIFQCKLSTLSNSWTYSILVNFTKRHLNWVERPLSVVAVERHNLTLRWTYMKTLGLASSFRDAEFTDLSSGEKTIAEKMLNTAPIVHTAYRPRFHVDYIQDTMASITIVGLKRSDRGRYRFDVKTLRKDIDELNTLSSIMELTVHYAANMTNVSDHQTVQEGSYLQLLCQAFGNPTPNITWTKVLENSNDSKLLHHGTHWNLTKINRTASGLYNCTADNGIGNPVWRLIKVNVTYSAKVVKLASEHHVAVQGSVSLHCEAEGNPPPAYTWFPCDSKTQACHESTLTVSNALNDAVYSCNVANVLGNDTRETKVVIAGNVINVTLFISEQCPDENLSESVLWKNLEQKIEDLFKNEGYRSTELTNYRCGSVIVDLALKFNSSVKEEKVLSMLKDSAENGGLKELGVKASEIVGWRPGRPTEGPNSSTYGTKTTENASSAVPSELPAQSGDNQGLKDWMIAVIAGASGLVLLFVVIFLLCWISKTQKKKKGSGDEAVDMSTTSRYVKNGPHHSDKPSSSRESIEDDPFIAASTYSQNSVDRRDRKRDSSVNYGYQPDDSDQPQGEMLLKSGSRLPKNDRLTQSTGELDVTSTYLAKGPQRDCSTLPSYHRPPSYEEASKQKDRIMMTEPRPSTSTGGRQKRRKSPPEDRAEEASVAPSEMRSNQDGHRSDKDKGPLDPTAIYAMPDKKKKLDKQSPASLESVFDPFKAKDKSAKGPILHNPGNLDLDGPANASTSEGPRNLIIPIEMLPSNRQTPQKDDTENGKSEPSSPLNFTLEKRPRNSSSGAARYQPERSKLPYRNVRGELVRPDTLDSHDIKPETLPNQSKPVGSQTHSRESLDASYITYVV
ncbi:unnamed protein product [Pocillopora meandrina]|uniref:Ig-like domain-containing protein n=1 Tax=Pocillopora meandrina TaxID=46732 RepID=A0AAU9XXV7_9CNID|nr:unnamed protein product [Pocillopora meandrina]